MFSPSFPSPYHGPNSEFGRGVERIRQEMLKATEPGAEAVPPNYSAINQMQTLHGMQFQGPPPAGECSFPPFFQEPVRLPDGTVIQKGPLFDPSDMGTGRGLGKPLELPWGRPLGGLKPEDIAPVAQPYTPVHSSPCDPPAKIGFGEGWTPPAAPPGGWAGTGFGGMR